MNSNSEVPADAKHAGKTEAPPAQADARAVNGKPDVTDEPKNEEHLHMGLLGNALPLRDVYLKVSDDEGQFFDNVPLEKKMIDCLGQSKKSVNPPP